ncbi:ras-related protein Rab-13-like [Dysidea avara]|uniref:ras-related protein Rab-13-like n=1 Tax=Dysidea avara TaxID=196820 RepID=UPI00332A8037
MAAEVETYDALIKLILIGNSSVGKTCLILRYVENTYQKNFLPTIGVDFKTKNVKYQNGRYKIQIWDTAGQERFNSIRTSFFRGAKGVIICYDITNAGSFQSIRKWMDDIENNCSSYDMPVILLVGNKRDKDHEREVERFDAETAALGLDIKYKEVSALTGEGVEDAFATIVEDIIKKDVFGHSTAPATKDRHTSVAVGAAKDSTTNTSSSSTNSCIC